MFFPTGNASFQVRLWVVACHGCEPRLPGLVVRVVPLLARLLATADKPRPHKGGWQKCWWAMHTTPLGLQPGLRSSRDLTWACKEPVTEGVMRGTLKTPARQRLCPVCWPAFTGAIRWLQMKARDGKHPPASLQP